MTVSLPQGKSTLLDISVWVSPLACLLTGVIGLTGLIGIATDTTHLYYWGIGGWGLSIQTAFSFVLLAMGLVFRFFVNHTNQGRHFELLSSICFVVVFLIGLSEFVSFLLRDPSQPLRAFLVPESPVRGGISIYSSIGLMLASGSSLISSMFSRNRSRLWMLWFVQAATVLLINISAFSFVENLGPETAFRFFTSLPSSLGLFFYGWALFFLPINGSYLHLAQTFFANLSTRIYTWLILLAWAALVFWQGLINNFYRSESLFNMALDWYSLAITDEFVEVLIAASIMGIGLHILGTLNSNTQLAEELQHSTQNLQEAFDSFALLAATLSHDLKTPIQTQISALEMIKSEYFGAEIRDEKNQRMMETLIENKLFELDLVANLVDLMRYEIHAEKFSPTLFEINTFLMEIEVEMRPLAEQKQLHFKIEYLPENTTSLYADYMGMKRLLHNLIVNAIQHLSEEGHIEVGVDVQPERVVFRVQDDGPGIPQELQAHLFEKFSQGPGESRILSSGLGLYIARQIVERHGGHIWVESSAEGGTMFCCAIPNQMSMSVFEPSSAA